jgi:hypothetical protein
LAVARRYEGTRQRARWIEDLMSSCKTLISLSLAAFSFAACGDDPSCGPGRQKVGGVCSDSNPVGELLDAGSDASTCPDAGDGGSCACPPGTLIYEDLDGDGVGEGAAVEGCPGEGLAMESGDCEPDDPHVFPGAEELCNGRDDDCDGTIDEEVTVKLYVDADGDGHGDKNDPGEPVCGGQARSGKVLSNDDCDDTCPTCSPENAVEAACDDKDDDCDGIVDDGVTTTYAPDCDGDGYLPAPDPNTLFIGCAPPEEAPASCAGGQWLAQDEALEGADCEPTLAEIHPGAEEICDGLDNNCEGQVDEKDGIEEGLWVVVKLDCDGDGYVARDAVAFTGCPNERPAPGGLCSGRGPGTEYRPQWLSPDRVRGEDCADADYDAHPGSTFTSSQHVGGQPDDYDYDCDGRETPLYSVCTTLTTCLGNAVYRCWSGAVPRCGQDGILVTYRLLNGNCLSPDNVEPPPCR